MTTSQMSARREEILQERLWDRAKNFFCDAYMNTGCDESEAVDHTNFMASKCDNPDQLFFEAERYRDM